MSCPAWEEVGTGHWDGQKPGISTSGWSSQTAFPAWPLLSSWTSHPSCKGTFPGRGFTLFLTQFWKPHSIAYTAVGFLSQLEQIATDSDIKNNTPSLSYSPGGQKSHLGLTGLKSVHRAAFLLQVAVWGENRLLAFSSLWGPPLSHSLAQGSCLPLQGQRGWLSPSHIHPSGFFNAF